MSAEPASWSPPADSRRVALLAVAAVATVAFSWALLHVGFYTRDRIEDTPIYERYGDAMVAGAVPYRDFGVEYPPGALPAFALPAASVGRGDLVGFRRAFETLMLVCAGLTLLAMLAALVGLEASPARASGALALAALSPLLLGSVVLSRFDLWPTLLAAAAVAALVSERRRLAHGLLAAGFVTKVYPLALLPLFVIETWRRRGRREAATALACFLAVAAAAVVPFLALSPRGVWNMVVRQGTRPLQLETLAAGFLLALHQATGLGLTMRSGHGSQNLVGSLPDALAAVQTALQLLALLAVWVWFARGAADRDRLVRASAAAVAAFVAFGKVLSPQYLIWLVPLVPLVRGRRGLAASALLGLALVLTQLWFPYRYWSLALRFDATASWLVPVRDLVLVALLAVLVAPRRGLSRPRATRGSAPRRSSSAGTPRSG